MTGIGALLSNLRAGESRVAWNRPALSAPDDLVLTSADFDHESAIPRIHAAARIGGENQSPSLNWAGVPRGTGQLLLICEDVDVPLPFPLAHVAALISPTWDSLPTGGLNARSIVGGVHLLKVLLGTGYEGPAPIKGHGPHRYVFQLFALADPIPARTRANLKSVLKTPICVLARGRLDGFVERE
ncbi:MAG: YbhB/YbcL family Raf kinase inhibitor-like protein [Mycobacterium sp.]